MVLEADDDDGPGQAMRTLTVLSGVFDIVPLFFERVVGAGWRAVPLILEEDALW